MLGWVGRVLSCPIEKKKLFSVGFVHELFQPTSEQVKTVEKARVATGVVFPDASSSRSLVLQPVKMSLVSAVLTLAPETYGDLVVPSTKCTNPNFLM